MFGMEEQPQQARLAQYDYELEKELNDPVLNKEMLDRTDNAIQQLKTLLRTGLEQEDYERFSHLLQGFIALKKVITNGKK